MNKKKAKICYAMSFISVIGCVSALIPIAGVAKQETVLLSIYAFLSLGAASLICCTCAERYETDTLESLQSPSTTSFDDDEIKPSVSSVPSVTCVTPSSLSGAVLNPSNNYRQIAEVTHTGNRTRSWSAP